MTTPTDHEFATCTVATSIPNVYPPQWKCWDCRTWWVECKVCKETRFRLRSDNVDEKLNMFFAMYQNCFVCDECRKQF